MHTRPMFYENCIYPYYTVSPVRQFQEQASNSNSLTGATGLRARVDGSTISEILTINCGFQLEGQPAEVAGRPICLSTGYQKRMACSGQ